MNLLLDGLVRLALVCLLLALALSVKEYLKKNQPKYLWLCLILALSSAAIIDFTFIEPNMLVVANHRIALGKLKEPIKIALVSDIHAGPYVSKKFVQKAVDKILAERPDAVFIAGDFFFEDEFDQYQSYLEPLKELAKEIPTYAVLGNHEYGLNYGARLLWGEDIHAPVTTLLTGLGVKVLNNQARELLIRGQKVTLVGANELWFINSLILERFSTLIGQADPTSVRVVLAHNPDLIYELASDKVDLFLTGHTHGGQVRLPFIGALGNSENKLPKKYYKGLSLWGQTQMWVTSGLGESGFGVRFFNPPRIDVLEVK